ncbi:MAG: hypothetical protein ACR2GR_06365 [Rhodothermales bacterium]
MGATAEVRWFYPGDVPEAVSTWFEALPGDRTEERRTDRYLRPTDAALNLKWREGQLEIKRRDAEGEHAEITESVAGRLERWRKWSFDATERTSTESAYWIDVAKTRWKRRYRVEAGGRVTAYAGTDRLEDGCDVEVTILSVQGEPWWSVCLEAFGDEASLQGTLMHTAQHVFRIAAPPALEEAHSKGYAAWLLESVEPAALSVRPES